MSPTTARATPRLPTFFLLASVVSPIPTLAAVTVAPEHAETRELVALVDDAARLVAERGVAAACLAFKEQGSRFFHDDTYVFVFDTAGNALCHPARPSYEGKSLIEIRDPDGKPVVAQFLEEVAAPGPGSSPTGWVHYLWPKPGTTTLLWKSTYLVNTPAPDGQAAIVGSGAYTLPTERSFVVEQVEDAAELLGRRGGAALADLRDKASGFRFLDTYVFVLAADGTMLVNAGFPELEGKSQLDLVDSHGKAVVREMLALGLAQGSGWVDYFWPRPGDTAPSAKSAYVRQATVDGKPVVIGCGLYAGSPERPAATVK